MPRGFPVAKVLGVSLGPEGWLGHLVFLELLAFPARKVYLALQVSMV